MTDYRKKYEEFKEGTKNNLKSILINLGVGAVSVIYIFYKTLTLEPRDLNPLVLLSQGIIGIIVGFLIKSGLGENGFVKGYKSSEWIIAKRKYTLRADQAMPYIDTVDDYYEEQRKDKLMRNRKTRLLGHRIKYETFFDENGDYIEHDIWSPKRKKLWLKTHDKLPENVVVLDGSQLNCLYKCVRLKIYVKNLFNEYENDLADDEHKEKTDKSQRSSNLRRNLFSAIGFSLAGVYFVPLFTWNIGEIIWALFQVVAWVSLGILNAYDNYYFITEDKVKILNDKEIGLSKLIIKNIGRDEFEKKYNTTEQVIELTPEEAKLFFGNK